MTLLEQLKQHDFPIFPLDGTYHRFDRKGELSGWFMGRRKVDGEKSYNEAIYGDWKTGEKYHFLGEIVGFSPDEAKLDAEKAIEERDAALAVLHETVRQEVQKIWEDSIQLGETSYMIRKKIPSLYGARIDARNGSLVLPICDRFGVMWSLQYINSDGFKSFHPGGKLKGCYFTLGSPMESLPPKALLCEGYATGVSLHLGSGLPVLVAFTASNLVNVALELRDYCSLTVCADDDWKTDGNPGLTFAMRAAKILASKAFVPIFPAPVTRGDKDTDWNDLHCAAGLGEVMAQWQRFGATLDLTRAPMERIGIDLAKLKPQVLTDKNGKQKKPTEQQVADAFLSQCGEDLVTQDGDLFTYLGTHWKVLEEAELAVVRSAIQRLALNSLSHSKVVGILELIKTGLPRPPKNIYAPDPWRANFLDGTLDIIKESSNETHQSYTSVFRPHQKSDYLLNVIPLNYKDAKNAKNKPFLEALERVFQEDADKDEKIRAIQEMYGAMICPAFPRFFLLHGPGGSGKTTLIIPASRLVDNSNISNVEPHEFKGFLMESMLGKLVNIVTDIDTRHAIDDANIKKVEDRVLMRIDRKFKSPIRAPLPAVHLFGANKLPPNLDGASGAHTRRWTLIECSKFKATGQYNKNFANDIFDVSPSGVLSFALEGLERLLQSGGHYTSPASGVEEMKQWQTINDPLQQWLDDIQNNEFISDGSDTPLFSSEDARIERSRAWKNYKCWLEDSAPHFKIGTKIEFYSKLRKKGFEEKKIKGVRYFHGFKVGKGDSSEF